MVGHQQPNACFTCQTTIYLKLNGQPQENPEGCCNTNYPVFGRCRNLEMKISHIHRNPYIRFRVNGSWKFYPYIEFIWIYCTWLMTIFKYLLIIVLAWSVDIPLKVILYKLTSLENLFDHNLLSAIPIVLKFRTEQGNDNAMCFAKFQSDWAMEMDVMDKKYFMGFESKRSFAKLYFEGILPKGPYPPCLRMADRALLAGYHRFVEDLFFSCQFVLKFCIPHTTHALLKIWIQLGNGNRCYGWASNASSPKQIVTNICRISPIIELSTHDHTGIYFRIHKIQYISNSDLVILVTYVKDAFNNNVTCDFRIFAESNYIHFGNTVYVWPSQVEARQPFQNNRVGGT